MADWPEHRAWCPARQAALATVATTPGAAPTTPGAAPTTPGAAQIVADREARARWVHLHLISLQQLAFQDLAACGALARAAHVFFRVLVRARTGGGTFVLGVVAEELAARIPHVLAVGYSAGTVRFVCRTREALIAGVNRGEVLKASHMR